MVKRVENATFFSACARFRLSNVSTGIQRSHFNTTKPAPTHGLGSGAGGRNAFVTTAAGACSSAP